MNELDTDFPSFLKQLKSYREMKNTCQRKKYEITAFNTLTFSKKVHFETFAFSLSNQVCCETRIKPQNCFVISGATCKLKCELLYLKTFNI